MLEEEVQAFRDDQALSEGSAIVPVSPGNAQADEEINLITEPKGYLLKALEEMSRFLLELKLDPVIFEKHFRDSIGKPSPMSYEFDSSPTQGIDNLHESQINKFGMKIYYELLHVERLRVLKCVFFSELQPVRPRPMKLISNLFSAASLQEQMIKVSRAKHGVFGKLRSTFENVRTLLRKGSDSYGKGEHSAAETYYLQALEYAKTDKEKIDVLEALIELEDSCYQGALLRGDSQEKLKKFIDRRKNYIDCLPNSYWETEIPTEVNMILKQGIRKITGHFACGAIKRAVYEYYEVLKKWKNFYEDAFPHITVILKQLSLLFLLINEERYAQKDKMKGAMVNFKSPEYPLQNMEVLSREDGKPLLPDKFIACWEEKVREKLVEISSLLEASFPVDAVFFKENVQEPIEELMQVSHEAKESVKESEMQERLREVLEKRERSSHSPT